MDCGGVIVKYILFIFNILFVVCGILLIVFGSLIIAGSGQFSNIPNGLEANSVAIAIIVLGCFIFLISFLGCCGAIREISCCTMTYSVIMLILFICQLALVIFIWVKRDDFLNIINNVVQKIWDERKSDQKVMDALQISLNCCGKDSFTDYGLDIPNSCCGASATSCNAAIAMTRPGCVKAYSRYWEKNIDIIRYAGLGVAGIELIAFIFACCLANQVRNDRRRANY